MVDRSPRAFAVDEYVERKDKRVATCGRPDLNARCDRRHRRSDPTRKRIQARVGGLGRLVSPERGRELPSAHGPPAVENEIDPEPPSEPTGERRFVDDTRVGLDAKTPAQADPHPTRKSQGRRATIRLNKGRLR